jgi:nucleotide sugar dehydrogenase
MLPLLHASSLRPGVDFAVAFSPERIDPGNRKFDTQSTPKVVGGLTPQCSELTKLLFEQILTNGASVHIVSSPRAAEMTKLLENCFRSVNIALVNELTLLCHRMGINVWEVVDTAASLQHERDSRDSGRSLLPELESAPVRLPYKVH